jgi:hypothetical protein
MGPNTLNSEPDRRGDFCTRCSLSPRRYAAVNNQYLMRE